MYIYIFIHMKWFDINPGCIDLSSKPCTGSVKMKASMRSREKTTNRWGDRDKTSKSKTNQGEDWDPVFSFGCRNKIHRTDIYIQYINMMLNGMWFGMDNYGQHFPQPKFGSLRWLRCRSMWHLELYQWVFFCFIETKGRFLWFFVGTLFSKSIQVQHCC